jgi:hypothetical protein
MLFSILIGAAATIYFIARAVIIKAKVLFSGGKAKSAKSRHKCVIYAEDKRYWNLFKPVLDEFEKRNFPLLYLTSSKDDPCFKFAYNHIVFEYIGEGNKSFARLNLLSADFVLMTTPGLDVYQLKRSKAVRHYSHLIHGTSDATLYRLFGLDYFDSVLLTGDYQGDDIRRLEALRGLPSKQLVTVGCPYLDLAAQQMPPVIPHPFTVLVSPSWGPSALLTRYGEKLLDPLLDTGYNIIVRPHPQSKISENAMLERLKLRYKDRNNIAWDYETDNIFSLSKSDIMFSDFSGIILDYVFLYDKPVIYSNYSFDLRPYDADDLAHEPWQFRTLKEIGIELRESDFASIGDVIQKASNSASLTEARRIARDTAWQRRGEAGVLIADFVMETVVDDNSPDGTAAAVD